MNTEPAEIKIDANPILTYRGSVYIGRNRYWDCVPGHFVHIKNISNFDSKLENDNGSVKMDLVMKDTKNAFKNVVLERLVNGDIVVGYVILNPIKQKDGIHTYKISEKFKIFFINCGRHVDIVLCLFVDGNIIYSNPLEFKKIFWKKYPKHKEKSFTIDINYNEDIDDDDDDDFMLINVMPSSNLVKKPDNILNTYDENLISSKNIITRPIHNTKNITQPPQNTTIITQPPPNTTIITQPPQNTTIITQPPQNTTIITQPPIQNTTIVTQPPQNTKNITQQSIEHENTNSKKIKLFLDEFFDEDYYDLSKI